MAEFGAQIDAYKDKVAKVSTRVVSHSTSHLKRFLLPQLNELFTTSQSELEQTAQQLDTTSHRLASTKESLVATRQDLYQTSVEKEQTNLLLQEHSHTEQTLLGQAGQVNSRQGLPMLYRKCSVCVCVCVAS